MPDVFILRPKELASQDQDRVTELLLLFGTKGLARGFGNSMQDLAVHLAQVEALFWRDALAEADIRAVALAACAEEMGFLCQAQVARDFSCCCERGDQIAAGATLARLVRLGESTLNRLSDRDISG